MAPATGPTEKIMSDYLLHPAALPTLRQRIALRLLHFFGWRLRFKPLPGPYGIAIVYPHTSNWDFVVGLICKWAVDLPFRWLAKDSLFRGPMGVLMRYWGGIAVDRSAPMGATRSLVDKMRSFPWCWIAITPEGTRGYRPHWKSGFYHLARAAKVPVVPIYIDYGNKELAVVDSIELSGNQEADMAAIAAAFKGCTARYPQYAAPITLASEQEHRTARKRA